MLSTAPGASEGSLFLNINDGAEVDASKSTTFVSGPNFFVTSGTGMLTRTVAATPITFPVGSAAGRYAPATITNAATAENFSVSVKGAFDYPVVNAARAVNNQWNITKAVSGAMNGTVALSWLTADQGTGFNPAQPVSVIRFNGTFWEQLPAVITGSGTIAAPYTATATGVGAVGLFGVQNTEGALPLSLVSFGAKLNKANNTVDLKWTTNNEINTSHFDVERSTDNRIFEVVGTTSARSTSGTNNYGLTDLQPASGLIYYRLKQVDKDGSLYYSSIVVINISKAGNLTAYPNPAGSSVLISHPVATKASLSIVATDGATLRSISLVPGSATTRINTTTLATGTYLLIYHDGEVRQTIKLIRK